MLFRATPTASCTNAACATRAGSAYNALSEARGEATMVDTHHSARFDRRTFVVRTGLLALGTVGASLLEACAPAAPPAGGAPASGGAAAPAGAGGALKLPTYVPFEGPKPDLQGNAQGLDPAFFKFPTDLVKSVPTPPGAGSTVIALTYLTLAPAPLPHTDA